MEKIFSKSSFKTIFLLIVLLCLFIFINVLSYVKNVSSDLSKNVLRLHVIANSDSTKDQNLKYIVRDNIIEYMNTICSNVTSKEDAIKIVSNNLINFENIANETIKQNGFNYTATCELGNFEFPTKTYSDISFPSGYYDALEIKLGSSEGKNWWCVLYPSLCFIDKDSSHLSAESKEKLQNDLSTEEYKLISDNNTPVIKFKFKLIELFSKSNLFTAKK